MRFQRYQLFVIENVSKMFRFKLLTILSDYLDKKEVFYGMLCNQKLFGLMLAERVETYKTRKFIQHVHVTENFSFVRLFII